MFTVMHRDNGSDTFYKAPQVQYAGVFSDDGSGQPTLHLLCGPGEAAVGISPGTLRGGEAFIMNDAGKTVGHYNLMNRNSGTTNGFLK